MSQETIEPAEVELRVFSEDDAERLYPFIEADREYFENGMQGMKKIQSPQDLIERSKMDKLSRFKNSFFTVFFEGAAVGVISYGEDSTESSSLSIGYWVVPEVSRKGIATQALKQLTVQLEKEHALASIQIKAYADNAGSNRVAQKAGYTLTDTYFDEKHQKEMNIYEFQARTD